MARFVLFFRSGLGLAALGGAWMLAQRMSWTSHAGWLPALVVFAGFVLAGASAPFLPHRPLVSSPSAPLSEPGAGFPTRGLYDAPPPGPRSEVDLAFELPDATKHRIVEGAMRRGTRAARRLREVDAARAKAEWRDVAGPGSRLQVRLVVEGELADERIAQEAGEVFADAFLKRLHAARVEARRR